MLDPLHFNYDLPSQLIAQQPLKNRSHSRLMLVNRQGTIGHSRFSQLSRLLTSNDVLILNQTKVIPARLLGQKTTGGHLEILLVTQTDLDTWTAISRPRLKIGQRFYISSGLSGQTLDSDPASGLVTLRFDQTGPEFWQSLDQYGHTPVPPYITTSVSENVLRRRYQTVYAKDAGSAAAPTAGLHFTKQLLDCLKTVGVGIEYITLHVGLGTFQPLRPHHLKSGTLHQENYHITPQTARRLNQAKAKGRRLIAVGTTTTRCLESALDPSGAGLKAGPGQTQLFIRPPYRFRFVDSLITNFHLPQTSLLMLVTALASAPNGPLSFSDFSNSLIGQAYRQAVDHQYRFFSFGDAMWIY